MKIMDRYLFFHFLVAYFICFTSMVGLYVIIDLFSNADEFLEDHAGTLVFLRRVSKFYAIHMFDYFNRLSPIITQIAAMITLASLHRYNEIVALLAAGVPTRRMLKPILAGSMVMIVLGVVNREIVLPHNSEILQRLHEDIEGNHTYQATTHIGENFLLKATMAHREDQSLENVNITFPIELVRQFPEIHCQKAYYRQFGESEANSSTANSTGRMGWLLVDPTPKRMIPENEIFVPLENGNLFFFSDVTFKEMIRRRNWMNFAPTLDLIDELQNGRPKSPRELRTLIHNRFMQPILNLLLVLIGIPFVLQWERRNIYRSIAISMVLSGFFFVVGSVAGFFALSGYIEPLTAAWLPVLIFGPICKCLFHRMGT